MFYCQLATGKKIATAFYSLPTSKVQYLLFQPHRALRGESPRPAADAATRMRTGTGGPGVAQPAAGRHIDREGGEVIAIGGDRLDAVGITSLSTPSFSISPSVSCGAQLASTPLVARSSVASVLDTLTARA